MFTMLNKWEIFVNQTFKLFTYGENEENIRNNRRFMNDNCDGYVIDCTSCIYYYNTVMNNKVSN